MNAFRIHFCVEKTISHVKLAPNLATPSISKDVIDMGQWMRIGDGICVELLIVVNTLQEDSSVHFWN
jgi:hypothetical protein